MSPGSPSLGWFPVWRRNFLVWRKLALPSILGNLADPLIYMLGLGYGLGAMLPSVDGQPYIAFLAAGTVCASTMNAATFEALYSSFSRMHVQKTWDAILNTPLGLPDVVAGELIWAATKSLFSGAAILLVIAVLGLTHGPLAFWALPAIILTGLAFAALGLIWNALAPSYDFFMYYFTLFITPMTLISGVFFPTDQLPVWLATIGSLLPLAQGVALIRPLLAGQVPADALLHIAVLLFTAGVAYAIALRLTRRRLLK
jgi:lipooligosaccharide transport system permease protein